MLWLIFCRHGVIHTQSLQKLLLEDDVSKPEETWYCDEEKSFCRTTHLQPHRLKNNKPNKLK